MQGEAVGKGRLQGKSGLTGHLQRALADCRSMA